MATFQERGLSVNKNDLPRLGVGVYTRADAARLLRLTPSRVGRWSKGYSYWLGYTPEPEQRKQPPVVRRRRPDIGGLYWLSFLELMELRIVRALVVDRGLSLQYVRKLGDLGSRIFDTPYPLASRRIFVEGQRVFASLSRDQDLLQVVELSEKRHGQIMAGDLFEQYLEEVDFDEETSLAERWWPMGRDVPVVLDPRIAFGAPVLAGTRIRTDILTLYTSGNAAATVARAFELTTTQVDAAVDFEAQLARAA
ncbi:MAG: DUF433 domain-containing protein [Gemmatimonadales bacterium]